GGHLSIPHLVGDFGFGRIAYPGSVALGLSAVALADRLRRGRRPSGDDPRLAFLVAGLLTFSLVVVGFWVPVVDRFVPSPLAFLALHGILPGLGMLRGLRLVRF